MNSLSVADWVNYNQKGFILAHGCEVQGPKTLGGNPASQVPGKDRERKREHSPPLLIKATKFARHGGTHGHGGTPL